MAFRLTVLYGLSFFFSSTVVFALCYFLVSSFLIGQIDQRLLTYMRQVGHELEQNPGQTLDDILTDLAMARGTERVFFYVLNGDGRLLGSSDLSEWTNLDVNEKAIAEARRGNRIFETTGISDQRKRLRILYAPIMKDKIFLAGIALAEPDTLLNRMFEVFIGMVLVVIIVGMSVGWQMARRAMSGVEEIAQVATVITQGRFDQRVSVGGRGEEIDRLAQAFNAMLEQVQGFITGMKEVNDNIAHDLRTPVTRIRGMAETTLIGDESLDEYQAMTASIIEECDRLLGIINTILDISETETGLVQLKRSPLDLTSLVRQGMGLFQPLCEEKQIGISLEAPEQCPFQGDLYRLQRLISNLLDNAVKFTPAGGRILLSLSREDSGFRLMVTDTGQGISEKDQPHIFERFYRVDRSRSTAGFGLGLALARSIARVHGGDIEVQSRPGIGSTFMVTLRDPSAV